MDPVYWQSSNNRHWVGPVGLEIDPEWTRLTGGRPAVDPGSTRPTSGRPWITPAHQGSTPDRSGQPAAAGRPWVDERVRLGTGRPRIDRVEGEGGMREEGGQKVDRGAVTGRPHVGSTVIGREQGHEHGSMADQRRLGHGRTVGQPRVGHLEWLR
jgi:hypothetical protein